MIGGKRSIRRHHMERMIARTKRIVSGWPLSKDLVNDMDFINSLVSTHCRPCSCWMCIAHKDVPPRRERSERDWEMKDEEFLWCRTDYEFNINASEI